MMIEFLQPYKPRPETSASVARNLVAGALGLQTRVSKEQKELERQKLKEARGWADVAVYYLKLRSCEYVVFIYK